MSIDAGETKIKLFCTFRIEIEEVLEMKRPCGYVALVLCLTGLTLAQKEKSAITGSLVTKTGDVTTAGNFVMRGWQIKSEGSVIRCHEECEITDHRTLLQADNLDYDTRTGETKASGSVRMKFVGALTSPPESH